LRGKLLEELDVEMVQYEQARHRMVFEQLISRGIKDERVLTAMRTIPRHLFVDDVSRERAYEDCALSIGEQQTISQPYMVACMTEELELDGTERVLEIGTGSGYQTAVLAMLAAHVWSLERVESLMARARDILARLQYLNITIRVGDGTLGWPEEAPFDVILVTAGSPDVPPPLLKQLKVSGRLIIPIGDRKTQVLHKIITTPAGMEDRTLTSCVFVPLIGDYAWPEGIHDNGPVV
jgi:protein-L-isoaspartate(D-aspartate) O-methyltransferase